MPFFPLSLSFSAYCRGMKKDTFWSADLLDLFKLWGRDLVTFLKTLLMFAALSLPIVIPALIMWLLLSMNWSSSP